MSTIPASQIVNVIPSVLPAGGNAVDLVAVMLTTSALVPIGAVQPFASAKDVKNYFGSNSTEGSLATIYFLGPDDSQAKPAKVYFAQYPTADVPAWLRGAPFGLTLAELQALPAGTLTIPINGANITAASVNLSTATSFSNAASIIQAAFTATQATAAGNTIAGTTLTLGGTITGTWAPGQTVVGVGVTAGTHILSLISGTPNTAGATYLLDKSSTVAVGEAMTGGVVPQVTYNSTMGSFNFQTILAGAGQTIDYAATGALATSLKLTSATGAVKSQGAAAVTAPGTFMDGVVAVTTDFASIMTCFDPDSPGFNANKYAFAKWVNGQANRYGYVAWDVDDAPATQNPATSSLGYLIKQANLSGTIVLGSDVADTVDASLAAFVCSQPASLAFDRTNGRTTLAFRKQTGLLATCTDGTSAQNLLANGYSFYGAYGTANDEFVQLYDGAISGPFLWFDSYFNQIWMNDQLQIAFMLLLQNTRSIPFNEAGYSLVAAAAQDVINRALNFGAIRSGIPLSQAQIAEVNTAAGVDIADTLQTRGWYFKVYTASAATRQTRGPLACTLWYTDGQSVQKIVIDSIEVV